MLDRADELLMENGDAAFGSHVCAFEFLEGVQDLHHVDRGRE